MSDKISTLEGIEQQLNIHARKVARKLYVREDIFTVHLVRKLARGDMSVVGGAHIDIYLLWPAVQPVLNSKLESAFRLIRTKNLYTPLAIATHAFFTKEAGEGRKWIKAKLGTDIADSLGSLIPKHRLQVITTTVVEVKDTVTGASVLSTHQKIGDHRDATIPMWSILSQNVIDNFPESVTYDEEPRQLPAPSPTPVLDETLQERTA